MTIAICDGILKAGIDADEDTIKTSMIKEGILESRRSWFLLKNESWTGE